VDVVVVVECQADLLEVISALGAPGGFTGLLNGRQEERDQERQDCDDDEKLNERHARTTSTVNLHGSSPTGPAISVTRVGEPLEGVYEIAVTNAGQFQ
jgi:hypothetical protein